MKLRLLNLFVSVLLLYLSKQQIVQASIPYYVLLPCGSRVMATDWPQILPLYDLLLFMTPSPVMRLNRAAVHDRAKNSTGVRDLERSHLFYVIGERS